MLSPHVLAASAPLTSGWPRSDRPASLGGSVQVVSSDGTLTCMHDWLWHLDGAEFQIFPGSPGLQGTHRQLLAAGLSSSGCVLSVGFSLAPTKGDHGSELYPVLHRRLLGP